MAGQRKSATDAARRRSRSLHSRWIDVVRRGSEVSAQGGRCSGRESPASSSVNIGISNVIPHTSQENLNLVSRPEKVSGVTS